MIWGVATLTTLVFVVDAAASLSSGAYLNLGTGVWLALARDTHDGVFYRELWHDGAYGGTRYFPTLFAAIAGVMRAGVPAVTAGLAVSVAGLIALVSAVAVLLRRLGVGAPFVALGAALAAAPYFIHQTAFAIRCEPIAAAFAIFGLATLARADASGPSRRQIVLAALCFVAAFATKITCVYAPIAAAASLLVARRPRAAVSLTLLTAAGALLFMLAVHALSDGRALESFRACALAGSSLPALLAGVFGARTLMLIGTSHLLSVVFALTAIALILSPRQWTRLPALYVASAAATTALVFASPGTILTSQILDLYVAAIVFLIAVTAGLRGRFQIVATAALLCVASWAAAQNIVRVAGMFRQDVVRVAAEGRRDLLAAVDRCAEPVLSESPMVPILAGDNPVLLDPFAFHVVALNRPDIGHDLAARVSRREFGCIVLEQDPATTRGRAWYQNVNLTAEVIEAVLRQYTHEATIHGQRIYRPGQPRRE